MITKYLIVDSRADWGRVWGSSIKRHVAHHLASRVQPLLHVQGKSESALWICQQTSPARRHLTLSAELPQELSW